MDATLFSPYEEGANDAHQSASLLAYDLAEYFADAAAFGKIQSSGLGDCSNSQATLRSSGVQKCTSEAYHHNYYFSKHGLPEPFQEVQENQAETLLPQAETHHERALRILEEEENQRKKELEYRTARKRTEREREKEIEQRKKEKERKQREKKIESRIRINERNARTNTCSLLSLT